MRSQYKYFEPTHIESLCFVHKQRVTSLCVQRMAFLINYTGMNRPFFNTPLILNIIISRWSVVVEFENIGQKLLKLRRDVRFLKLKDHHLG